MSSSDLIVQDIVRGLYEGRYVPGQKLIEGDLTDRFGVGRGSVREALKRLAAERIVTESLHKGARIHAPTREELRDLLEVVEVMVALAARRAAERLRASSDIKALRNSVKAMMELRQNPNPFQSREMHIQFYQQLAQISENQELIRLIPATQAHLIQLRFKPTFQLATETHAEDFIRVIEAVLAKDGAKAEREMRRHVRTVIKWIDSQPDEIFGA